MLDKFFPLKENWVVFFDLFSKSNNGDSIRPIAVELRKRRPDLKFFFCCKKKKKEIEMADEVIVEKTLKFKYVCSRAKYIISPMGFPNKGKKRKGQVFAQTWHGTPMKKIYLSREPENKKHQKYVKQFKNADIFCASCDFCHNAYCEALNIKDEQIANTGLPRNDILFKENEELKKQLKKELKIPEDKKVILYCPTWRRYDYKATLPFNISELKKHLKDEYVILIRSHVGKHIWVNEKNNEIDIFDNEFSFDGGKHGEITELYLISDILITDYSSAMFDFAITEKPQIFYAYDLEEYKKEFQLYFDYKSTVPGPVAVNTKELIEAIKTKKDYTEKIRDFKNKFCSYEKGNAAEQVVDLMLNIDRVSKG